jgi:DMSO/TMAO reductase YedYZ molybdopterin-dependent catalytic subunit
MYPNVNGYKLTSPIPGRLTFRCGDTEMRKNNYEINRRTGLWALAAVLLLGLLCIAPATAAADVLFDGDVGLGGTFSCYAYYYGEDYTVDQLTPLGALDAASGIAGFTYDVSDKKYEEMGILMLDNVGSYVYNKTTPDKWAWSCMVNDYVLDDYTFNDTEGLNIYALAEGDEVIFYYGNVYLADYSIDDAIATVNVTVREVDVLFQGEVNLGDGTFVCHAYNNATGDYDVAERTPLGALDAAAGLAAFTYDVTDKKYYDTGILMLDNVDDYDYNKTTPDKWAWYCNVNDVWLDDYTYPTTDGLNIKELYDGDEVVFYYGNVYLTDYSQADAIAKIYATVNTSTEAGDWDLELSGAIDRTVTKAYFEDGVDCGHNNSFADETGTWEGMPLWYLVGMVDDDTDHGPGAFNDALAAQGYQIVITAGDGYDITLASTDVARNDDIIVANTLDGEPLPLMTSGDPPKPLWPLRLSGADVSGGNKIGNITSIELQNLPEPPSGWELEMRGIVIDNITQAEFEEGASCHPVEYTDGLGQIWTGVPLWYLCGAVDDYETSDHWTFNDTAAAANYTINVMAGDGYDKDFYSIAVARSSDYIVANEMNGTELAGDDYPLKLVGPTLSGGQKVGNIQVITLTGIPQPDPGDWEIVLKGNIQTNITQTLFEEAATCPYHQVSWTDTSGRTWSGIPLWFLAGWVDDRIPHGPDGFNDALSNNGYTIYVKGEGEPPYIKDFTSGDVAHSENYIVANKLNGSELSEDDGYPLRLVGPSAGGGYSVRNIYEIELGDFNPAPTEKYLNIIKYDTDGVTIIDQENVSFTWVQENLPVWGEPDGTHLQFQGPTFDPEDLWNPAEDKNPAKVDDVIKGTALADLVDLVGGMADGNHVKVSEHGTFSTTLNYTNVYAPAAEQGEALLAWWTDAEGDDYGVAMRLFFNAPDGVFGNWNMHNCIEEAHWHYYWSGGVQYPSAAGISCHSIDQIEVYTAVEEEWTLDMQGAIHREITKTQFEQAIDCDTMAGHHKVEYTDPDGATWEGMPLWLLCGWVDDTNEHSGTAFNDTLAEEGYNITIVASDGYSVTINSTAIIRNTNYIIANSLNGSHIPPDNENWPLRFTGANVTARYDGAKTVRQVVQIILDLPHPANVVSLEEGWNFISTPKRLSAGNDTAIIFDGVETAGHSIFTYDAATGWVHMTPQSEVVVLEGIWIYSAGTDEVILDFDTASHDPPLPPPSKPLSAGWNAIGFSDVTAASARDSLFSVNGSWATVIGYDAQAQAYESSIISGSTDPNHTDATLMYPTRGYWLSMSSGGVLSAISG